MRIDPEKWKSKLDTLREVNLFADTSDFDLLTITESIVEIDLKANEAFLSQYDEVKGVYFIKEPVNVYEHNSKIATVTRNGIFGDDPCITGEIESSITARPTKDCKALYISRDKFVNLIRSIPGLQEKVFQDVVERARQGSVRAEEQRRLIQEILDNIGQGSFSIDMAGEIGENYTAIASEYLGVENLAGVPFADIAFRRDRKVLRNYYRALHMLFSGNQFDNSMVLDLLPREITINEHIFKLYYSFVQDGTGNVMSVFVRMEDLTLERELEKKEKDEKSILDKMQQNIGGFMDMLNDAAKTFSLIDRFAEEYWDQGKQPESEYINEVMRTLHGSKGLCGQFELNKLKAVVHSMEDWFLAIEKDGMAEHNEQFMDLFQKFESEYQYGLSFKENLGEGIIRILEGVSFTQQEFAELADAVKRGDQEAVKSLVFGKSYVSAERIVSNWQKDTSRLAEKLSKKIDFQLEIEEDLTVPKELAKTLNVGLGHLYRNCVDHGIELPEKRLEAGKDETGTVKIKMGKANGNLILAIEDDGAGLDNQKIAQLARDNPNLDQNRVDEYVRNQQYWKILFLPGFSSASEVTDVSGRGVGMDAVQSTINDLKGTIEMDTVQGKGSAFRIEVPMETE
ncbi:MAG: hypothetical protein GY866_22380 [Proteobacteria bacterium]|nr:hypothetical protein [Pseudomonadota bacterium]